MSQALAISPSQQSQGVATSTSAKSQGVAMVSSTEAPHLKAGDVASGADTGPDTSDAVHPDAVLEREGKTVPPPLSLP